MTTPARTQPPEAAGPGVEDGAGGVIYGHNQGTMVYVEPRVTAEERDRNRAQAARHARCPRCMDVPDDLVQAAVRALHAAARTGRTA